MLYHIPKRLLIFSYDSNSVNEQSKEVREKFQPTITFVESYLKNVVDNMWTFRYKNHHKNSFQNRSKSHKMFFSNLNIISVFISVTMSKTSWLLRWCNLPGNSYILDSIPSVIFCGWRKLCLTYLTAFLIWTQQENCPSEKLIVSPLLYFWPFSKPRVQALGP